MLSIVIDTGSLAQGNGESNDYSSGHSDLTLCEFMSRMSLISKQSRYYLLNLKELEVAKGHALHILFPILICACSFLTLSALSPFPPWSTLPPSHSLSIAYNEWCLILVIDR